MKSVESPQNGVFHTLSGQSNNIETLMIYGPPESNTPYFSVLAKFWDKFGTAGDVLIIGSRKVFNQ